MKVSIKQKFFKGVTGTLLMLVFLALVAPFLTPIILAAIVAFALHPKISKITRHKNGKKRRLVILLLIMLLLAITIPLSLLTYKVQLHLRHLANVDIAGS